MKFFLCLFVICFSLSAIAHEGHHKNVSEQEYLQKQISQSESNGKPKTWLEWFGSFHLILVHFPIALINMVAVAELLFSKFNKPIFDFSARFMLISAAIIAPPTALLGLLYSYSGSYQGIMATFLWWHMWLGILTAIITVALVFMRESDGPSKIYYATLAILILIVNITGFFGGGMVFGPSHMNPPL